MKKITISILTMVICSGAAFAQMGAVESLENEKTMLDAENIMPKKKTAARTNTPEVAIWSEDFSNGIPTGWTNTASNMAGLWEYRGATTTPNTSVGSRGAYATANDPITSPTAATGFVIFDSDYLDNGGTPGNVGPAVAPHFASLTTSSINLASNPSVELSFYQYYRKFTGLSTGEPEAPATYVSFSNDGGTTWSDRIALNRDVWVNYATAEDDMVSLNVSSYIGGAANAKIRFDWDGDYYFWMIDDIELNVAPVNEIRLTPLYSGGGAPAIDVANADTNYSGKYGMEVSNDLANQIKGYSFDANVINYGTAAQTNVKLTVNILDANNTLVTSVSSPIKASLASGDTLTYADLNTMSSPWTAGTTAATYRIAYMVTSTEGALATDTINYSVSATHMALDRGTFFNSFGNANTAFAVFNLYEFSQDVAVGSIRIRLAGSTVAGGKIDVYILETSPYDRTANPPSALLGGAASTVTISQADVTAGFIDVPVTDGFSDRVSLLAGTYIFYVGFPSTTPRVSIWNDVSIDQPGGMSQYYSSSTTSTQQWYSGNLGSNTCNALAIRPLIVNSKFSVAEETLKSSVSVGPNPANDFVNVMFKDLEGDFNLTMTDVTGRVVASEVVNVLGEVNHTVNVSSLSAGVYMLNVNSGAASVTYKISVQ